MTQLNSEEGRILQSGAAIGASPFTLVLGECGGVGGSLSGAMNEMNDGARVHLSIASRNGWREGKANELERNQKKEESKEEEEEGRRSVMAVT